LDSKLTKDQNELEKSRIDHFLQKTMKAIDHVPQLISQLYEIVEDLEGLFPGRHFTLDGHLVGSIGEVFAEYYYEIRLSPASMETHDGVTSDGKHVQIKATQGERIGLRSRPDYLLVLKILPSGTCEEIYNGPGQLAWNNTGKLMKNGQRSISLTKLRELFRQIPIEFRLSRLHT